MHAWAMGHGMTFEQMCKVGSKDDRGIKSMVCIFAYLQVCTRVYMCVL